MKKILFTLLLISASFISFSQQKNKLWFSASGHQDILAVNRSSFLDVSYLSLRRNFDVSYARLVSTSQKKYDIELYVKYRKSFIGQKSIAPQILLPKTGARIATYGGGVNIRKELMQQEQVTFAVSNSTAIMHIRDDYLSRTPWKNMLENSLNAEAFFEMSPKMDLSLRLSYSFWFDTRYPEPYQNKRVSNPLTFSLGIGF